jgi:hypothetical protein
MKHFCFVLIRAFIISAAVTQLVAYALYNMSLGVRVYKATLPIVYTATMTILLAIGLLYEREPRFPARKLRKIARENGYSAEFYRTARKWHDKCVKKSKKAGMGYGYGYCENASLVMSELLMDGGHCAEAFDMLEKTDYEKLSCKQRQIYFNTYLYGAVICGDSDAADRIYRSGRSYLVSVTSHSIAPSVKHTLGCYEFMCGNLNRAEELFVQSLGSAKSCDVACEDYLGLCACYLETGRFSQAKSAVETAAEYAVNKPLKQKLERAMRLVETEFDKLNESVAESA